MRRSDIDYCTAGRCVKLERCTNVCEKTLMNMAKKRPTSISLLSSRGTVKQEAMHKLFKGVANTLKVCLNRLI